MRSSARSTREGAEVVSAPLPEADAGEGRLCCSSISCSSADKLLSASPQRLCIVGAALAATTVGLVVDDKPAAVWAGSVFDCHLEAGMPSSDGFSAQRQRWRMQLNEGTQTA